jgi:shikimate dehydrogenase
MGNPVAHSRSPAIHARFAELTGQHLRYERRLMPWTALPRRARLHRRGGRGCNITVPFKFEAAALATWQRTRALAGAANTLSFDGDGIHADNTDGLGLVADITRNAGVPLAGRDVLLVGAGGAAAGVLGPLLQAGVRHITVANRTVAKAEALVQHMPWQRYKKQSCSAQAPQALEPILMSSSTPPPAAWRATPCRCPPACCAPAALAYDMMYGPAAQGFLDWAKPTAPCPRRPGHAGGAGRRGVCPLARRAPAIGPGAGRTAPRPADPAARALPVTPWPSPHHESPAALAGPGGAGPGGACSCSLWLRIAPWPWPSPESTTFQRSEAWRSWPAKGSCAGASSGCPTRRFPTTSSAP